MGGCPSDIDCVTLGGFAGGSYTAPRMLVELRIGPVVTNVKALIVPVNYPIVGTDIGSGNLLTIMASKFATQRNLRKRRC